MNRLALASTSIGSLALGACYMFRLNHRLTIGAGATGAGILGLATGAYYLYQHWSTPDEGETKERGIEKLYYQHENFFSLRTNWEEVRVTIVENKYTFIYLCFRPSRTCSGKRSGLCMQVALTILFAAFLPPRHWSHLCTTKKRQKSLFVPF